MEIRQLSQKDFYELRQLLDTVFTQHSGKPVSFSRLFPRLFERENSFAPESHWGAFADGKLVGTAAMYPIDYVVGGRHIRLIANGNVAVHAMYRGQGIMGKLLEKINEECDQCGDLCYLHGNPVRYGRFGYVAGGVQYLLTVCPGMEADFSFRPMQQDDVAVLNQIYRKKTNYITRSDDDFIPALRSGGREAVAVLNKIGQPVGYLSFHAEKLHVEEYGFLSGLESRIFPNLARSLDKQITVTVSGYDLATVENCKAIAEIQQKHPALFRVIHPEVLQEAALALGLEEKVFYAPYLT